MDRIDDLTLDELRDRMSGAVARHACFDGWTDAAVTAAADEMDVPRDRTLLAFKGGVRTLLEAYLDHADRTMLEAFSARSTDAMRLRDKVTLALRLRLEQAEPVREAVRRAATLLASPVLGDLAARSVWRMADRIWRALDDPSTDINYYSKRMTLGGVYTATLLYWLADESEGRAATWAFLDRRIDGIIRFEGAKARMGEKIRSGPSLARFLGRLRYPVSQ